LLQQMKFPARDRLPLCPGMPATREQFAEWFTRYKPDALLVNHSPAALEWLRDLGKQVPRDVGLVELEDRPEHACAGINYDPAKIGALAVEMLVGLMHRNETGIPVDQHEVLLSGEWREGATLPSRRGVRLG
jgi:LacI family transcriptional regulator